MRKAPDGYQVSFFPSNATNYYKETWEDGIQLSLYFMTMRRKHCIGTPIPFLLEKRS